jgi:hypothetical protein
MNRILKRYIVQHTFVKELCVIPIECYIRYNYLDAPTSAIVLRADPYTFVAHLK